MSPVRSPLAFAAAALVSVLALTSPARADKCTGTKLKVIAKVTIASTPAGCEAPALPERRPAFQPAASIRAGTCLCQGVPASQSRRSDAVSSFGGTPCTTD